MNNTNKLISVRNLTKIFSRGSILFKTYILAVNNVSFEIEMEKPEIFTLAGESGSGKSTLARMLLGLVEPTYGTILYKGKDIVQITNTKNWMWFTKEVQPIFQNPFETFSPLNRVEDYLYDTARNYKMIPKNTDKNSFLKEYLNIFGLSYDEIKGKYPHEFSGGQLQRLSIARALITNPSLLIADEPVSMIDASLRMSVVNLFKELKNRFKVSVIYITHDLATAYYISDKIAIMLRGNIVELGPVEKVLDDPLHPYTKLLKQSIPEPTIETQWDEEIKLSTVEEKEFSLSGCKFAGRCPYVMEICKTQEPEEISVDGRNIKCHLYKKS
ncbi:MAG TPA: ABC transporter ATP-binding protein [Dictyoglomaceae bacterium]|nr:ABC transporter ATP-binding protein [Dictyoglomaceae bacterium]